MAIVPKCNWHDRNIQCRFLKSKGSGVEFITHKQKKDIMAHDINIGINFDSENGTELTLEKAIK